jgi:hypothetical protein
LFNTLVLNAQHSSVRQRAAAQEARVDDACIFQPGAGSLRHFIRRSSPGNRTRPVVPLHCRVVTKAERETHSGLPRHTHTHTERLHTSKRKLRRASRRRLCFCCLPNESNFAEVKTNSPPAPLVHLESLDYLRFASLSVQRMLLLQQGHILIIPLAMGSCWPAPLQRACGIFQTVFRKVG